jgi:hypothetical protein
MSKVNGVIARILTNTWQNKTLYSIVVEGDERAFGTGATRPQFGVGTAVEFEAERNAKGYWNANPATLIQKPLPVKQVEAGKTPEPTADFYKTPANKDKVIELQSCRNSAIALLDILVKNSMVKLPTKKDEQYDAALDLVDELVGRYVEQNDRVREGKAFLEEAPMELEQALDAGSEAGQAAKWDE